MCFADANDIAWVRFAKGDRKAEVMAPYLRRAAHTGRSQVAAIGVAQEFQRVWAAYQRETAAGVHSRDAVNFRQAMAGSAVARVSRR